MTELLPLKGVSLAGCWLSIPEEFRIDCLQHQVDLRMRGLGVLAGTCHQSKSAELYCGRFAKGSLSDLCICLRQSFSRKLLFGDLKLSSRCMLTCTRKAISKWKPYSVLESFRIAAEWLFKRLHASLVVSQAILRDMPGKRTA